MNRSSSLSDAVTGMIQIIISEGCEGMTVYEVPATTYSREPAGGSAGVGSKAFRIADPMSWRDGSELSLTERPVICQDHQSVSAFAPSSSLANLT